MARIVLVHGAFNELWGPHELKARELPALRDGLWHEGVEIADADVDVCFYGDLFRRAPGTEAEAGSSSRAPGSPSRCRDLARRRRDRRARAGGERRRVRPDRRHGHGHGDDPGPPRPDAGPRRAARRTRDPGRGRAFARHVLSYQALCNHPQWTVDTFVTLGSPLASPMIFEHLDPPPVDGVGRVAGIGASGGSTCAPSATRPRRSRSASGSAPRVEEVLVDNGHRAHDPEPYLNAAATGAAIARRSPPTDAGGWVPVSGRWRRRAAHG